MIVIGVDPGLTLTGVVIIGLAGDMFTPRTAISSWDVSYGPTIRLARLAQAIMNYSGHTIDIHAPGVAITMAIEQPCYSCNAKSLILQSKLAGIIEAEAYWRGWCPVHVAPSQAKKALAGNGNATKEEMVACAKLALGDIEGSKAKQEAIADAYGVALAGAVNP